MVAVVPPTFANPPSVVADNSLNVDAVVVIADVPELNT